MPFLIHLGAYWSATLSVSTFLKGQQHLLASTSYYLVAISHSVVKILVHCFTKYDSVVLYCENKQSVLNKIWLIHGPTQLQIALA